MKIALYAGSIRPGGGLTVIKMMIDALAKNHDLLVYTGEEDTSKALESTISAYSNVFEKRFMPSSGSGVRYLASKFFFLFESKNQKIDLLISINYFMVASCSTAVYHLNLLSFMVGVKDSVGMMIKRFDARLACKFANKNIFESKYLRDQARTQLKVRGEFILYIGVAPEFNCGVKGLIKQSKKKSNEVIISVVSSPSPHKDNSTCLRALSKLIESRPEVNWLMTFVGGVSKESWGGVLLEAESLGLKNNVQFLGPLEKKELSLQLNNSLCLMNASLIESFCMVAIESMASCCPVIVTNATSMPESVGDAGVIVPERDVVAFVNAVVFFYDDEKIRNEYVEKGIYRVRNFTNQIFVEKINGIIQ